MMELRVCHLYPDVLNLYGDRGNVLCIKKRLEWRGIGCTVTELPIGERRGLGNFDLFFVGGGQDFEQGLLLEDLRGGKGADIRAAALSEPPFQTVMRISESFQKQVSPSRSVSTIHAFLSSASVSVPILRTAYSPPSRSTAVRGL